MVFLLALTVALSQAAPHQPLPTEGLEKYEDAPAAFVWRTELSPGMVSQHGAFTSYQVNVNANGQNIAFDAANEPSISVDPTNPSKMAIGWRQFNSVNSNFRQAGWGYTGDGGATWTFPGVLENNVFRSDPVLAADASGQFFYLSLLQNFFDDMWRSINGGQSWTRLAPATGGDKQWFTIDTTNSSGHGFQYQCWSIAGNNYGGRQFTRSIDGGFTWMDPINIPNSPAWGTLDVDADGNLFIGGVNLNTGGIWCVRSTNAKNGGVIPSFDHVTAINLGGFIASGESINPEGILGQVFLAADRSGTSTNNNVYMLASIKASAASTGSDVMFVRSTNGGQTFSAPRRINDDQGNSGLWHWFATMSVAPNGRIDAVWLDTRNSGNNFDSQLLYSYSRDGGDTWSPNVAVSDLFDPSVGYPNQNKIGDYITMVSDNGGGNVAYAATFNSEEDIYYVRVAPPTLHLLNIATRTHVSTEEQVLIAGFIITGTDPKQVIIRGIGPSLNGAGVTLSDPTLELHQGNTTLVLNDNWKTRSDGASQQASIEATHLQPTNDSESAILMTLSPGAYTAILAGKNGGTGVGVVEVYDLTQGVNSQLANISSRGFVETNDNVMIGGLIIGGGSASGNARVLVRAIGPSLTNLGIQGALADPTLELHDANGATTATNDNWKINDQTQQSQEAELQATGNPPSNDLESAIVATLGAGPHTAIVRGKNNSVGVGLVEVYNLQ
ncbi:MAG TPA: sialidase family protein [Chthoniobacterales bacterium]|nr:sialidase family protein [Chthoniobacterales bacterium]